MPVVRCFSFVAVSTKQQGEQDSPESQSRGNIAFIEQLGKYYPGYEGRLVKEVRIVGTRSIPSLEQACERYPDEYGVMRDAITSGEIDIIVCRERDRLGRKLSLVSQITDLCDNYSVIILARNSNLPPSLNISHIKADESRPIIAAVEGALAETYVRRFLARSRDGREARVREKKLFTGHVPYGYTYAYRENGEKAIVVVQKEADVLLKFFTLYMDGHGEQFCANYFNSEGVESPEGGKWYRSAFTPFLRRIMIYAGYVDMYREDRSNGEHFMVKGNHPPIISEDMARMIIRERKSRSYTRAIPHTAFAGICICTSCGKSMLAFTNRYKKANGADESVYKGYTCKNPDCTHQCQIRDYAVRDALREAIIRVAEKKIDLSRRIGGVEQRIQSGQMAIDEIRKSIADAEDGKETLLDLLLEKKLIRQQYDSRIEKIDAQIKQLQSKLDIQQDELNQLKDKASVRERIEEIKQFGLAYLDREKIDPESVSSWMKRHFRIYVLPGRGNDRIREIEII